MNIGFSVLAKAPYNKYPLAGRCRARRPPAPERGFGCLGASAYGLTTLLNTACTDSLASPNNILVFSLKNSGLSTPT